MQPFLSAKAGQGYQKYIETRNCCKTKRVIKNAPALAHKRKMSVGCKDNPRQFWKYVQGKLKPGQVVILINTYNIYKPVCPVNMEDGFNQGCHIFCKCFYKFITMLLVIVNINSNVPKLDETWFQVVVHCTHKKWCKWFYF